MAKRRSFSASFFEQMIFADCFPASADGRNIVSASPEPLADFPYDAELKLKNQAIRTFLKKNGLPAPEPVVPAPCFRKYRSTGKRRITCRNGSVFLHLGRFPGREPVVCSQLEPDDHQKIYEIIHRQLSLPRSRSGAEAANYCIVRGAEQDRCLILNVRYLSGDVVRVMRSAAERVQQEVPSVKSAFLYVDESGSDYYLEAERPEGKLSWKKLFGPEKLSLRLDTPESRKFLYPPTGFSQINESILPCFAACLAEKTRLCPADQLLDLYCGYGLWSLLLAPQTGFVWGAELSANAIRAARDNAAYHYPDKTMKFEIGMIDAPFLRKNAPAARGKDEVILLDPPRHGTLPGVQEYLISRHSRCIAHVFCGIDEIPAALRLYQANGCAVESLTPFDFFPGTLNLEMLAVLRHKNSN